MRAIASQLHRFVVQSFRPGTSTMWNDEAWSSNRRQADTYLSYAKRRCPDVRWRVVVERHNFRFCPKRQRG